MEVVEGVKVVGGVTKVEYCYQSIDQIPAHPPSSPSRKCVKIPSQAWVEYAPSREILAFRRNSGEMGEEGGGRRVKVGEMGKEKG